MIEMEVIKLKVPDVATAIGVLEMSLKESCFCLTRAYLKQRRS